MSRSAPVGARLLARATVIAWVIVSAGCGSSEVTTGPRPPVGNTQPNTSGYWRDRVFYEVFVRSFADSDGDGVGDLKGLTAHLDDLNDGNPATTTDLGVDALWLMPIFPSPSYHGYDVKDYRSVNPQYGTLADLDALVAAAHARGIKIVLSSNPHQSEEGVAPRIGQCCAHAMGGRRLADRAHRPVR